jgi:NAD dependent epimerase/dehydratase family
VAAPRVAHEASARTVAASTRVLYVRCDMGSPTDQPEPRQVKLLVTGGAGYIGSIVARALLSRGHAVVVLDNVQQGYREAVPTEARLVVADLLDREGVGSVVAGDSTRSSISRRWRSSVSLEPIPSAITERISQAA